MATTRRALLVGISRYTSRAIPDLATPERDVKALHPVLTAPEIGAFSVETTAPDIRHYDLKDRIQGFFKNAQRSDELLIYVACHGLLESGKYLYFAGHNTDLSQIASTAVPAIFLCDEMAASPSEKVMALIDCCFSGQIEEFMDAEDQLTRRLGQRIRSRDRGVLVLTSADRHEVAVEGDDLSHFAQVLVEGLRTGDADLDGDGYVKGMDLHDYVERRFAELGYDQRPRLVFDASADNLYVAKNPSRPLEFDEDRYRNEVLDPFRHRGRLTRDLVKRYQLRDPSDPVKSLADMQRTLDFWEMRRSSLTYGNCVRQLEAEHEQEYRAVFDEATAGNWEALPDAIRTTSRSSDALADQLEELAGELGVILAAAVDQLVAQGHERSIVAETMRSSGIEVAVADLLPIGPPVPQYQEYLEHLRRLECRQLADLLRPYDPRWLAGVPLLAGHRTGIPILSNAVQEAYVRDQAEGPGDSAAHDALALLRSLDENELRILLADQIAGQLRVLRRPHRSAEDLLVEATNAHIAASDARQIVFAVHHDEASPSAEAVRLIDMAEQGKVAGAYRSVSRDALRTMPPDAVAVAQRIRSWHERAERLYEDAQDALAADQRDEGWCLLRRALRLAPDRADIRELLAQCPPQPARDVQAEINDDSVEITWQHSASPAAGIEYLVKRAEGAYQPGPGAGRSLSRSGGSEFKDRNPPFNRPLWYAVVPERGGFTPEAVSWCGPVHVRPEVRGLEVTGQKDRVVAQWQAPAQAVQILIERRLGDPDTEPADEPPDSSPEDSGPDAQLLDASPGHVVQHIDENVSNGTCYRYRIAVIYLDSAGASVTTRGLTSEATPAVPPDPVQVTSLMVVSANPPRAVLEVGQPRAGTVHIYAIDRQPSPFGTVVPRAALDDMGIRLPATPHASSDGTLQRLEIEVPDGEPWLTAVTVNGDRAVLGGAEQCRRVPPVDSSSVTWERNGDELQLFFPWPKGLHEIEAHWEQRGSPPGEFTVTEVGYKERGLHIPVSGEGATISLHPVVLLPSRRLRGPDLFIQVPPRPVVEYRLTWKKRMRIFSHRHVLAGLTLSARQETRLTRLVLVSSSGSLTPLRITDGEVVGTYADLELGTGHPHWIPVNGELKAPCWVACFAPDDDIDLRDPPPGQRRRP